MQDSSDVLDYNDLEEIMQTPSPISSVVEKEPSPEKTSKYIKSGEPILNFDNTYYDDETLPSLSCMDILESDPLMICQEDLSSNIKPSINAATCLFGCAVHRDSLLYPMPKTREKFLAKLQELGLAVEGSKIACWENTYLCSNHVCDPTSFVLATPRKVVERKKLQLRLPTAKEVAAHEKHTNIKINNSRLKFVKIAPKPKLFVNLKDGETLNSSIEEKREKGVPKDIAAKKERLVSLIKSNKLKIRAASQIKRNSLENVVSTPRLKEAIAATQVEEVTKNIPAKTKFLILKKTTLQTNSNGNAMANVSNGIFIINPCDIKSHNLKITQQASAAIPPSIEKSNILERDKISSKIVLPTQSIPRKRNRVKLKAEKLSPQEISKRIIADYHNYSKVESQAQANKQTSTKKIMKTEVLAKLPKGFTIINCQPKKSNSFMATEEAAATKANVNKTSQDPIAIDLPSFEQHALSFIMTPTENKPNILMATKEKEEEEATNVPKDPIAIELPSSKQHALSFIITPTTNATANNDQLTLPSKLSSGLNQTAFSSSKVMLNAQQQLLNQCSIATAIANSVPKASTEGQNLKIKALTQNLLLQSNLTNIRPEILNVEPLATAQEQAVENDPLETSPQRPPPRRIIRVVIKQRLNAPLCLDDISIKIPKKKRKL